MAPVGGEVARNNQNDFGIDASDGDVNKPDAVNPAIAPRVQLGHHWRGVTDLERSADLCTRYDNITIL